MAGVAYRPEGLSGAELKLVAAICMLVDHADAALLEWGMVYRPALATNHAVAQLAVALHCVGRLAFPLYVFLLVEGFFHTRSRALYLTRLVVLAAVSEPPFDLALMLWRTQLERGVLIESTHQNVLFTLALGFVAIWSLEELRVTHNRCLRVAGSLVAVLACCLAAASLHADYAWQGVLAIVAAYLVHRCYKPLLTGSAIVLVLALYSPYELFSLPSVALIGAYDGTRGTSPLVTRFNYAFYPGHLFVLGILRVLFVM